MTTAEQNAPASPGVRAVRVLRGNCMGAAVLLIVQFGIGMGINLYVTLPQHKSFFSTVFGQAAVAVHAIVALLLLGASISALVRAIRAGNQTVITLTAVGLVAILVAAGSGAIFVNNGSNGASLAMALATAVAMFSYLAAVFTLGQDS
ncbi:MAG: hypothetical protein JOY82_05815 [Streptosporangiaceae bacterium]|nr:hypothetical protein [Streptosporangiaceae bacterium]MBV9854026.1 hypothetical protein [Streptosporangiaceae bacterium]